MIGYKVKVIAQITIDVTEEDLREDDILNQNFDASRAEIYAKSVLIERLRNRPNYGHSKIEKFEYE